MVTAVCSKDTIYSDTVIGELWQYDYGQTLRIQGLDLPRAVEVQFSNQSVGGKTESRIGLTVGGVTDVPIPDLVLANNDGVSDFFIYAFVFISDKDSGRTQYKISIPVNARSKPELSQDPEDPNIFYETIKVVTEAADRAEQSASLAQTSAEQVAGTIEDVTKISIEVKKDAEDVRKLSSELKEAVKEVKLLSETMMKKPAVEGISGQVLISNGDGTCVWTDWNEIPTEFIESLMRSDQ